MGTVQALIDSGEGANIISIETANWGLKQTKLEEQGIMNSKVNGNEIKILVMTKITAMFPTQWKYPSQSASVQTQAYMTRFPVTVVETMTRTAPQ